jgi:hypothetical protein
MNVSAEPIRSPRRLPEVPIGVAEVPEIALGGRAFLHHGAAGHHGLAHDLVHGPAGGDDVVEGDAPEPRPLGRDAGVLGRGLLSARSPDRMTDDRGAV